MEPSGTQLKYPVPCPLLSVLTSGIRWYFYLPRKFELKSNELRNTNWWALVGEGNILFQIISQPFMYTHTYTQARVHVYAHTHTSVLVRKGSHNEFPQTGLNSTHKCLQFWVWNPRLWGHGSGLEGESPLPLLIAGCPLWWREDGTILLSLFLSLSVPAFVSVFVSVSVSVSLTLSLSLSLWFLTGFH